MDPQPDREDSTEGSGESEEAAEAPAADDAASAGPYAQAALQSLLAYDSAIAQQVSEIAAEQRAAPGTYREHGVSCRRTLIIPMCVVMSVRCILIDVWLGLQMQQQALSAHLCRAHLRRRRVHIRKVSLVRLLSPCTVRDADAVCVVAAAGHI